MAAAVPSTSASFLPVRAAQPLAGSTVSFGASYQKRRKIPARRVRCAADDEGANLGFGRTELRARLRRRAPSNLATAPKEKLEAEASSRTAQSPSTTQRRRRQMKPSRS
ncbi:hypothetical protein SETIT_8G250700v2 [Setaria italica]|uniref:Uncharacterized protein n=1 Tax=Setaria italica TaxID=4555 RepID=A0A368SBS2_SETIT|nr:hypothetical protein SETIT_8G250700v2 [Setaria italica]